MRLQAGWSSACTPAELAPNRLGVLGPTLAAPKAGLLVAPNPPKAGVLLPPKSGVLAAPKAGVPPNSEGLFC
jgi:hypothetical protein